MLVLVVQSAVDAVNHCTVPGSVHPFLTRVDFYTTRVNGVRFPDWLNALPRRDQKL